MNPIRETLLFLLALLTLVSALRTEQLSTFVYLSAMAEWQSSGLARYGTVKLLSQNCDFIDDNTCVKVDMAEATNDKGEKMRYK